MLVVGYVVIASLMMVTSVAIFKELGWEEPNPIKRAHFLIRAALMPFPLAAWVGWYVVRAQRIIETAREELRAERRKLEADAVRAEQAAGLGACARIVAHEVRNPLNTLAIHCEVLDRRAAQGGDAARLREVVDVIRRESKTLKQLVDGYIACVRGVELEHGSVDLAAVVREVIAGDAAAFADKDVEVHVEASCDVPQVSVDEDRMADAIRRLVVRAREASPRGAKITVRLQKLGSCVSIAVEDRGPKFEEPSAIFRPFFVEPNAGFEFAIVRDIVRAHGGEIHARNDSSGRAIVLTIPAVPA